MTRTRRRAIRRQTAAFFALMLGVGVPVWTVLDRALLSRWLLAPDEAIALAALAVAATAIFWWARRFA